MVARATGAIMTGETRRRPILEWSLAATAAAGLVLVVVIAFALAAPSGGEPGAPGPASAGRADAGATPGLEVRSGKGPHELGGAVTDASGQPVASAWVVAELELGPGTKGGAPARGGAPSTAGSSAASTAGSSAAAVARSDRAGAFALKGLEAGRHRLRVEGPGLLTAEVRFVDVPGPAVQIVVARRAEVSGRVTDGGRPVAGAAVQLVPLGGAAPLASESDASGRFSFADLPEGRFRLWAGRGDRAAPAQAVDRVGPGPFAPLELALVPAAIVSGRVVDASTGRGVAAHVTLVADDPDEPPRAATSSAAGTFRVEGVPLGRWTADAFAPGYVGADSIGFAAGADSPSVALQRGGVLAGRVVDVGGEPVAGAEVMARAERGGDDLSQETVARRLGDGPAGGLGWDSSLASSAGLVTATGLRYIPRGELGVVVGPLPYPPPPGAVAGDVRVASPLGRAAAAPARLPVDPALEPLFVTDGEGRFRLTGLAPGLYRALASHRDFADGASEPREIALGSAHDDVEVVLRGGVVLQGVVADETGAPVAGAVIEARAARGGPDPRTALSGPDGRYRLGPLGTDVTVLASAPGRGSAVRDVAVERLAGEAPLREENFTLVRADAAISGRVSDAGGTAARGATVSVVAPGGSAARATTDAGGHFHIGGVTGGRHRVRVEHPDYPAAEFEVATGEDSELRLELGGGLAIEVRDGASGAALPGAQVAARGPDGAERSATTGPGGALRLAPLAAGTWTVRARARGYAARSLEVDVAAASRPGELSLPAVRVDLSRGATLAGVVRDRDGARVAGAAVAVGESRTTSDADGHFRLVQVATGPVTVEVEKGEARGALDLQLAPGDELVTLELRLE